MTRSGSGRPTIPEHFQRPLARGLRRARRVGADDVHELPSHLVHRIEGGQRVLEDHRDLAGPEGHASRVSSRRSRSRPSNRTAPLGDAPGGLDQAHDRQRADALARARFSEHAERFAGSPPRTLTPRTASARRPPAGNATRSPSTASSRSLSSVEPRTGVVARVEDVAQCASPNRLSPITVMEMDRPGEQQQPPFAAEDELARLRQHDPPARVRRLHTESDEAQTGLREHAAPAVRRVAHTVTTDRQLGRMSPTISEKSPTPWMRRARM